MRYSLEVQENVTIALRHIESTPSETLKLQMMMMKKMKKKMRISLAMITKMKVGVEEEMCPLSKLWLL